MSEMSLRNVSSVEILSDFEIDQISGGVAPLAAWALWTGGGFVVGLAGAAIVHFFGNGKHAHK